MPKIYSKGCRIDTIFQLAQRVHDGHWVFYRGKLLHPAFVLHMTFSTVIGGLNAGAFFKANKKGENE